MGPRHDHPSTAGAGPAGRTRHGAAWELLGVGLTGLGVLGLALLAVKGGVVPTDDAQDLLVLGTVGLGAAAAILGDVAGRLSGDVRPSWIAAALAVYTLVVVPSGTLWPEAVEGDRMIAVATRMSAFSVILVLLVLAVRPPARSGHGAAWLAAGGGVLVSVGVTQAAATNPEAFTVLAEPAVLNAAMVLSWLLVAVWLVVGGIRRRDPTVWWMALGIVIVAVAHIAQAAVGAGTDPAIVGLVFDAVRLVGMLTVLIGTLQLVRGDVQEARSERWELEEDLLIAVTHLDRARRSAAERDHELRNGLSGLAGVTRLLSDGTGNAEREQLRQAVLHELTRLASMVEREAEQLSGDAGTATGYDIGAVLADTVTLARAGGARIELTSLPCLIAEGSPDVLAQVVGNLLANCVRHAPGSAVRVRAGAVGRRLVVEVDDDGPGVLSGQERLVLQRGVRNPAGGGQGVGLYVSSELLASAGGSLRVLPRAGRRGCTVVVELPRLTRSPDPPPRQAPPRSTPSPARPARQCTSREDPPRTAKQAHVPGTVEELGGSGGGG